MKFLHVSTDSLRTSPHLGIDISRGDTRDYDSDEHLEYTLAEHLPFLDFRPADEIPSSRKKDYIEVLENKLEKKLNARKKEKKAKTHCNCCLCNPHLYPSRDGDEPDGGSGNGGAAGSAFAC